MPRCADQDCGRWRPARLGPRNVGFRLNGSWFCSRNCLETAIRHDLDEPARILSSTVTLPPLRLGVLLRHLGVLTAPQLQLALNEQRRTGLRLGAQLRALELVAAEPILRALAAQANISYLTSFDTLRARGCSPLPVETVRALGVVPFEHAPEAQRISVVCAAPVPRAALRALLKLTGLSAEPYLVEDQVLTAALDAYRPADGQGDRVEGIAVVDRLTAPARIAEAVAVDRSATMRYANYDQYTWVRIEGQEHVSDLLVSDVREAA